MKKLLFTLVITISVTTSATAEVNMPGEPSFGTPTSVNNSTASSTYKKSDTATNTKTTTPAVTQRPTSSGGSGPLDSLAMSALRAAEKHDNAGMNAYIEKMIKAGAEGFTSPQIIAKQTPHCPPIKIEVNGRKMSGSMCGMFGYLYKGKQYDVGYCK